MDFQIFFYALIGIASLVYLFLYRKNQYWKNRNVPYIEPELFYGNTRGISKKYHMSEFMLRMYTGLKPRGPIGGIYMFLRTVAIATDLDLIKAILVKDFNIFPNRGVYYNEKDDPLSANLVNIEDDHWRSLRHKITPTFTSGKLRLMFGTVSEIGDRLIERIHKETSETGQLEVKDILARFTTDVIGSTAFGIECNSLEDKTTKFYEMGLKAFGNFNMVKRIFLLTFKDLSRKLHLTSTNKDISEFYIDVVGKTVKYREENPNEQRQDFMNLLVQHKNSGSPDALTFNQIAAQSQVFFLAGFETSSTTLTYCMYELSLNDEIQRKARESIKQVLLKHKGILSYEAVNEMNYLEQCVNEALRKHPPAANIQREAKENYSIPNTNIVIEKRTAVIIPVHAIHWDPEIYPKPEIYDPDRFLPENVRIRHEMSFMPFGQGPRVCIASRFATVEVKLALVKILTNFEFSLDRSKTSVPLKSLPNRLILTPSQGVFINFKSI